MLVTLFFLTRVGFYSLTHLKKKNLQRDTAMLVIFFNTNTLVINVFADTRQTAWWYN